MSEPKMTPEERVRQRAFYTGEMYAEGYQPKRAFKAVLFEDATKAMEAHAKAAVEEVAAQKDGAYDERNRLVAALAAVFPSALSRHPEDDTSWDDDWRWIVFVDLPTGQASWHIHDSHLPLFAHVRREPRTWDGHTTPEKYERVARFCNADAVAHRKAALAAVAEVTWERDEARQRCREAAQILIAAIGAPGPEAVTTTARRAVERIEKAQARVAELEAAFLALLDRYERDANEGDGIPEDAREWDAAVRLLMPSPMSCKCATWAGSLAPREGHHEKCVWERRRAALAPQAPKEVARG